MKNIITAAAFLLIAQNGIAQKKVVPVSASTVTDIALPAGSKKDSRLLIEVSAKALLQAEAKKTGATVNNIEVLYLPVTFNNDSLNQLISAAGWTVTVSATGNKYLWLQKDSRSVLAYLSAGTTQTELYAGETSGSGIVSQQQTTSNEAAQQSQDTTTQQTITQQPVQNTFTNTVQDGFAYSTTNFNDGWTSIIQNDWVLVSKGDIKVYLWYALPYNASDFSGTGVVDRDYYWDNYVSKYYNIQTKQYKDNGEVLSSQKPGYVEGWATDKQTGEKRFIGMRLDIAPNTAYIRICSAKDEAALWQQFPKANGGAWSASDISNMSGYNKFAIGENDLLGTWQDGNTSAMQWYYTAASGNPGGYAGMTVAARSATFNFNAGGNYTSIHNGATGAVGAMSTFQQNYKGKYTVSNWAVSATKRWDGKTENFDAWFEIIRGGRILHLDTPGIKYSLVKAK